MELEHFIFIMIIGLLLRVATRIAFSRRDPDNEA